MGVTPSSGKAILGIGSRRISAARSSKTTRRDSHLSVQPAPGLAATEHAAKGAALNPQCVRAFQRDGGIIGAAGIRIENSSAPFGILAGLHVDENLLTVLARLRVHRIPAKIGAALLDSNLALFLFRQPNAKR